MREGAREVEKRCRPRLLYKGDEYQASSVWPFGTCLNRGFEKCSVWKKCRNIFSLLLPLFLSAVRRSSDLAMAMEARGYSGEGKTSRMYPLVYHTSDRIAYILMFLFLAGVIVMRIVNIY